MAAPAALAAGTVDERSGGLLKFFLAEDGMDIVERLVSVPSLRAYASDASFVSRLKATQKAAKEATTPEALAEVTRSLMHDPRLTQCAMLGAGVSLKVDEHDLKKAEREGDIAKRSPLRVDDLVEAEGKTVDDARKVAKEAYARGDVPRALAYWTRCLRHRREQGLPDDVYDAAALYSNVAQGLLKLEHYVRAEQAATRALAYVERAREKKAHEKRRARFLWKKTKDKEDKEGGPTSSKYSDDHRGGDAWPHHKKEDAVEALPFDLDACERKALYRRAVAREGQRKFEEGLSDARAAKAKEAPSAADPSVALVKRLEALVESEKRQAIERAKRKEEERRGFQKRAAGVALTSSSSSSTKGTPEGPGASVGYVDERDYSSLVKRRLAERVKDVDVDLGAGANVKVDTLNDAQSSVSATVNVKRGKRALYYDLDVTASWTAEPPPEFDLSDDRDDDDDDAEDRRRPISGTVRLYNVSHETRYEPGADPNVAYMYQLGYRGIKPSWFDGTSATDQAPDWAKGLIDGAHALYEALANAVDAVLKEFTTQLDTQSSS